MVRHFSEQKFIFKGGGRGELLNHLSQCMRFPTMWYVRPAKPQISLCLSLEYSMTDKLLTEHHLDFLRLKGGCRGSSESTHVKMHIVGSLMPWLILFSFPETFQNRQREHSESGQIGKVTVSVDPGEMPHILCPKEKCFTPLCKMWSTVTQLVERLGIEGLLVQVSLQVESLCCVLEHDTLCALLILVQPRKTHPNMTKNR